MVLQNQVPEAEKPTRGARLAARVASALYGANVPNVLWSFLAFSLIETNYEARREAEFVIPDDKIQQAKDAQFADNFDPCSDPTCPELQPNRAKPGIELFVEWMDYYRDGLSISNYNFHPVGAFHFLVNTPVQSEYKADRTLDWNLSPRYDMDHGRIRLSSNV